MKVKFNIEPHIGASQLKLGMSRSEVHEILGSPEYSSEPSVFEFEGIVIPQPARDGYYENELQVTYDENGKADFIEFSGRRSKYTRVYFNGIDVFATPAPELLKVIIEKTHTEYDKEDEEIPYSYLFHEIDMGLWRQVVPERGEHNNTVPDDDDGKYFWTIGIGVKGYYKKA